MSKIPHIIDDWSGLFHHFADRPQEGSTLGAMLVKADMYDKRHHEPHSGIVDVQITHEIKEAGRSDPEIRMSRGIEERMSMLRRMDADSAVVIEHFFGTLPMAQGGEVDRVLPLTGIWKRHMEHQKAKERGAKVKSADIELHCAAIKWAREGNQYHSGVASQARVEATAMLEKADAAWGRTKTAEQAGKKVANG